MKIWTFSIPLGIAAGWLLPLHHPSAGQGVSPVFAIRPPAETREPLFLIPSEPTGQWARESARRDPQALLQWLLTADPQPPGEIADAFFRAWIGRDPDAAFAAVLRLPGRLRDDLGSPFFQAELRDLLKRDPRAAFRWVGRLEDVICAGGGENPGPLEVNSKLLAKLVPAEVAADLRGVPVGPLTSAFVKAYAGDLVERDRLAAVEWMKTLDIDQQRVVFPVIVKSWARTHQEEAMSYLEKAPSALRQAGAITALRSGFEGDAPGAMRWLWDKMGLTPYDGLNHRVAALFKENPEQAKAYVERLMIEGGNRDAGWGLFEGWVADGPADQLVKWILTLPAELQLPAAGAAMKRRMPTDFVAFLDLADSSQLAPQNRDACIRLVAGYLNGGPGIHPGEEGRTRDAGEQAAAIAIWLRFGGCEEAGRNDFVRESVRVLANRQELRDQIFKEIEPGGVAWILAREWGSEARLSDVLQEERRQQAGFPARATK